MESSATNAASERTSQIQTLGEAYASIEQRFDASGALGVMLVDASFLNRIERRHGDEARIEALNAVAGLVREVGDERLQPDDLVVLGEVGRSEVLVLFFRSPGSAAFCRTEMPGFGQCLQRSVSERGQQLLYPYVRRSPSLWIGMSVAMRNPRYGVQTQLRDLVERARTGADLERRQAERDGRRDLLEMILDGGVYSVYEPIVDVHTRTVFGYESLARGREGSPFHAPIALFQAAEEHDLVFELDCLCRKSGLEGAIDFPDATNLFLNVLPTSIHDPNFRKERLIETLEACKLSPSEVVFEISEQESIRDFAAFREMSDEYRNLGFRFALDDTGSGYAGLEELIELQPEFIKMDRNMVSGVDQDPARQEVLAALLAVADKMGSKIIGEGLDTLEELEMLGELGIHFGQGWLFGRPTPLRARAEG